MPVGEVQPSEKRRIGPEVTATVSLPLAPTVGGSKYYRRRGATFLGNPGLYRSLEVLRRGLIPYWAKDIKIASRPSTLGARTSSPSRLSREASGSGAVCCRSIILCCDQIVGNLALAGGRAGAQFYHRYDHAERAVGPGSMTACRWS